MVETRASTIVDEPRFLLAAADVRGSDLRLLGGKAAGLHHLTRAGLPVPRWMVLTTAAFDLAIAPWIETIGRLRDGPAARSGRVPAANRGEALAHHASGGHRRNNAASHDDAASDSEAGIASGAAPCAAGGPAPATARAVHDDATSDVWNDAWDSVLACVTIPVPLRDALAQAWNCLAPGPLAVRSSATIEDQPGSSFSGQFDTVLDVGSPEGLEAAVLRVWRSLYAPRARAILSRSTVPCAPLSMAVILQAQVTPTLSGVAHTVDVTRGRLSHVALSVVAGRGEALVSGEADAPTYHFPRTMMRSPALRLLAGGAAPGDSAGPARAAGLDFQDSRAPLSSAQVAQVLVALDRIERLMGVPQDVELAFDGAALWVLQSRPIAAVPAQMEVDPSDPAVAIWDNSNIAESYAGPVSPLTFSFLRQSYHDVYRQAGEVLGLATDDVRANEDAYQHLLGYFRGRVYYNLRAWYELAVQLPGGERNARSMELMMGVKERLPWGRSRVPGALRRLHYALRLLWLYHRSPAHVARFKTFFEDLHASLRGRLTGPLSLRELSALYRELLARTEGQWTAPILVDVFAMVFYGALNTMATQHGLDSEGSIVSELLAGAIHSHASAPLLALSELARLVRQTTAARAALDEEDPVRALHALSSGAAGPEIARALERYLADHGDRFAGELKLEEPPLRENPEWIIALLTGAVGALDHAQAAEPAASARSASMSRPSAPKGTGSTPGSTSGSTPRSKPAAAGDGVLPSAPAGSRSAIDAERREAAQARVRTALSGSRVATFFWCLRAAQRFLGYRETLRYDRSRMFGLIRDIVRRMGQGLAAAGALEAPEDVFFLRIDEVLGYIDGQAVDIDLASLVRLRRAEWDADRAAPPPPDRFWTIGAAHVWFPVVPAASTSAPESAPASTPVRASTGAPVRAFTSAPEASQSPESEPCTGAGSPLPAGSGLPAPDAPRMQHVLQLTGTPCSPGIVTASVTLVDDPRRPGPLVGRILVARSNDPGWAPLYAGIAGLLLERGSALSHAANIAREMGIPAVVSVVGLTRTLRTGMRVTMDGARGRVTLLPATGDPPV